MTTVITAQMFGDVLGMRCDVGGCEEPRAWDRCMHGCNLEVDVLPENSSSVVSDSCSHKDAIEIVPTVSCPFQEYRSASQFS